MTSILLSPKFIKTIATLDNEHSMIGIAVRDAVDNTPRIFQAMKRNPHEGRERFIEEFFATLVWGFGISSTKWVYDTIVPLFTDKLAFPGLDYRMISGKHPQRLTAEVIGTYAKGAEKAKLLNVLNSPTLHKVYQSSSVGRFLLSTLVPAMFLGFVVPKLNHAITRNALAKEINSTSQEQSGKKQESPTPVAAPNKQGSAPSNPLYFHAAANPSAFPYHSMPACPFAYAYPQQQHGPHHKRPLRFSGMGQSLVKGISAMMQDEQKSAMYFLDGPLSAGRILTARNPLEGLEIAFKELNIVTTLFLLPKLIKPSITRWANRLLQCSSQLNLEGLHYLNKKLGTSSSDRFIQELEAAQKGLGLFQSAKPDHELVVGRVRDYFHNKYALNQPGAKNLILEFAEKCNWVPLKKAPVKRSLVWKNGLLPTIRSTGGHTVGLDLTRTIAMEEIMETSKTLTHMAKRIQGKGPGKLAQYVQRSMKGNVLTFAVTNLLCFLYLAVLVPKMQYWLTYKITGKHHFPGIDDKQMQKAQAHL